MYGETFYGRHTAQHQLLWWQIKIKMSSYNSNENIRKKEDGLYYVASANKASSVTLSPLNAIVSLNWWFVHF